MSTRVGMKEFRPPVFLYSFVHFKLMKRCGKNHGMCVMVGTGMDIFCLSL